MNTANSLNGNQTASTVSLIKILIVDDQKMIREGLKALLKSESDFDVVGTAEDGQKALEIVAKLQPDIVLVDIEMPQMDGVTTTKRICEQFPDVKVLVLSSYDNDEYVSQSVEAGAKGYLLKGTPANEVREAIRAAHRGYVQIGPGLFDKIMPGTLPSKHNTAASVNQAMTDAAKSPVANKSSILTDLSEEDAEVSSAIAARSGRGDLTQDEFDQTVVLKQSPIWSRAVLWSLIGVTVFSVAWAAIAKIEQVVMVQGQLEPEGAVKEVKAPINGVVEEVLVEEGAKVEQGDTLLIFDTEASQAELDSLKNIRNSLQQENKFYRALMNGSLNSSNVEGAIASLDIPQEIALLARNRAELVAENQLYQVQLGASPSEVDLTPEQVARLRTNEAERISRTQTARLEGEQLEKQYNQNRIQLAEAQEQLTKDLQVLREMQQRYEQEVALAENSLEREVGIVSSVEPLVEQGAIAKLQLERQQQEVNDRRARLQELNRSANVEMERQEQQIESRRSEIEQLREEQQRLIIDLNQAEQELLNTQAFSEKDIRDQIAENKKQIAQIDSQINRAIVDNDKQVAEINSQLGRAQQTIKYQEVKAPVSGTVFDLQAFRGYVPNPNQTEPLLRIVPDDQLVAEVFIPTQEIGFVRPGMKTDIRIDTFPFSEFGDIKGEVISVGSDALEPDQIYQFYRYPAKVKLDQQYIEVEGENGREIVLDLNSGMSISVNIKIRENRTVLSLLTEQFTKAQETFKEWR